jgi:hypothetical protein
VEIQMIVILWMIAASHDQTGIHRFVVALNAETNVKNIWRDWEDAAEQPIEDWNN